jgi:hypothetical protein
LLGFGKKKPEKEKIPKNIAKLIEDSPMSVETMEFFADADNGQLILTNKFALIGREGFMNKFSGNRWDKACKIIPYERIEEIQFKDPGTIAGYIQFVIQGGPGRKTMPFALYDDNTVTFRNKTQLEELKKIFEKKGMYPSRLASELPASIPNIADEISKLASLKKEGLISDDEFAQLKTKLMNEWKQ